MKDSLAAGIDITRTYTVAADQVAHVPVLSTPSMIAMIEATCIELAQAHLDDGEATVGTHVCVSHVGIASVGDEYSVNARLTERERRRLTFEVEVQGPNGLMSDGTHKRAVIDTARFG